MLSAVEEDIPRRFSSRMNKLSVLPDERETVRGGAPLGEKVRRASGRAR